MWLTKCLDRFVSFIAGSFAAVLILASVLDPDIFLHFEITPGRTVLFYIGCKSHFSPSSYSRTRTYYAAFRFGIVFSSAVAITRGMVPDAHQVFDPEMLLREVVRYTHYLPDEWEGQLHSKMVRAFVFIDSLHALRHLLSLIL